MKSSLAAIHSELYLTWQVQRYFSVDPTRGVCSMQAGFIRFDGALIEYVFQPLANSITYRIGLDRLRVAGFCLDAASIAWILAQAGALTCSVAQWDATASFLRALLLLL